MSLKFQDNELLELMKDFYTLTGLRMVLFDEDYNEIFAYPEQRAPFCQYMRKSPLLAEKCCQSDISSFEYCKKTHSFSMYRCHAGLTECTAPIMDHNTIIGYIMFGQISDRTDKTAFRKELMTRYPGEEMVDKINKITFKKSKQLLAASKILETCTSYILAKEMVTPSRIHLFNVIDNYISAHLDENLDVATLCKKFNISRTRLYAITQPYVDGKIAGYIKDKRLEKAKELLKEDKMSVAEIACAVGFADYNYFLRSFKARYSISPIKYKKNTSDTN